MIYDAVIIGAGPAGSYAGCLLAKAGLKVALVDRMHFPRNKLCGGLLTCKTAELLQSVCQVEALSKFDIVRSHVFYLEQLTASFRLLSPAYTVRRLQFDAQLVEVARKQGVQTYFGAPLRSIDFAQKKVCLWDGRTLRYSVLIGADGAQSTVRRFAGLPKNEKGFCLETHVPWALLKDPGRVSAGGIEIYYGDYPNGYGWVFPCKESVAVGVGNLAQGMSERDLLTQYRQFLNKVLTSGSKDVKPAGAYLPSGSSVALGAAQYEDVCLIGDAAGLIDPFTGEGIYYALLSARTAAESIISSRPAYTEYERRMRSATAAIQDTVRVRDHIYSPAALKHLIAFMQSAVQYSEELINETIVQYTKTYADAYEEIKYYSR